MTSSRLCVSKREIVRRLRDEGFELERQVGSHMQWKNWRLKKTVTVPDRRELVGNMVKTIYEQAGWNWAESLQRGGNTFSRPPQIHVYKKPEPRPQPELKLDPPAKPVEIPIELVEVKTESKEPSMNTAVASTPRGGNSHKSKYEVEIMALDLLERPHVSRKDMALKWKCAAGTIDSIRKGTHQKLAPKTLTMLQVAYGQLSPVGAPALMRDYNKDPESLPTIVRNKIEAVLKVKPQQQLVAKPTPAHFDPPTPTVEPPKNYAQASIPSHGYVATTTPQHQHAMVGYTPEGTCRAPVRVGPDTVTLQEMIDGIREAMRAHGITKMTIPVKGDVVVQRREILR